jgi:hypothetical protein
MNTIPNIEIKSNINTFQQIMNAVTVLNTNIRIHNGSIRSHWPSTILGSNINSDIDTVQNYIKQYISVLNNPYLHSNLNNKQKYAIIQNAEKIYNDCEEKRIHNEK